MKNLLLSLGVLSLLGYAEPAFGAALVLQSERMEVGVGQEVSVLLMLDSQDEILNAVEGAVVFPQEVLQFVSARDGDSVVNLWVERPALAGDTVFFSGVMPGGFSGVLSPYYRGGRPGKLFEMTFVAKEEGEAVLLLQGARALLHDGEGTLADLEAPPLRLSVVQETPEEAVAAPQDVVAPEPFTPVISQDANLFDGKWFVVFVTQDKGSGVARYEVAERRGEAIQNYARLSWREAESPYLLRDQELKSTVYVKVVDWAGNERTAMAQALNPFPWYEKYLVWIILIVVILVFLLWGFLVRYRPN
ncbi:MAG: cohesin domain-containing protein [bacterium]|nr:cohesin domain-containing protein [bacterium]